MKNGSSIRKSIIENLDELLEANVELGRRVSELERLREALVLSEKEVQSFKLKDEGLTNRVEELEKKVGQKEREAESAKVKAEELRKKVGELEKRLSRVGALEKRLGKAEELERRLVEKEKEAERLRGALELKEDEVKSTKLTAEGLTESVAELEKRLGEKEREVEQLREALKLGAEGLIGRPSDVKEFEQWPSSAAELGERPRVFMEARHTPWFVKCDKCGRKQSLEFTVEAARKLLDEGYLMVECANPDCSDQGGRHGVLVELRTLM